MRDVHLRVVGVVHFQPTCDLLRRPSPFQLLSHDASKHRVPRQLALLRPRCPRPSLLVSSRGSIAPRPPLAVDFTADRRRRPTQPGGDRPQRLPGRQSAGDLLALVEPQPPLMPLPWHGFDPAATQQIVPDRARRQAQRPAVRNHRIAHSQPRPDRINVLRRQPVIFCLRTIATSSNQGSVALTPRDHPA